jgi:adenylate cyclase
MPKIHTLPDNQVVEADPSETILEAILDADIPHTHACGGNAFCSTCRVMILEGSKNCSYPTEAEKVLAKKLEFPVHVRLACQTKISGDVSVRRLVLDNQDIDLVDSQLTTGAVGKEQSVALLFASVQGANNFDQVNFPYDILYLMTRYFQRMQRVIRRYGGSINSYMSGQFLATFPEDDVEARERAIWAGLKMLESLKDLNHSLEQLAYHPLTLKLGIHYGSVMMVPIDPARCKDLLPLGNGVNLVSKIAAANGQLNTQLLVSEQALETVKDKAVVNSTHSVEGLKRGKVIPLHEITEITGEEPPNQDTTEAEKEEVSLSKRIFSFVQKLGLGKSNNQ